MPNVARSIAKHPHGHRFVAHLAARLMNEIAHALGKLTFAEFLENEESFRLLAEFGVDYGQRYHLGQPDIALPSQTIVEHAGANIGCRL